MSLTKILDFFEKEIARANDYFLYHTTNTYKALKIIKSNSLQLPLAQTNANEAKFAKKTFYLSFARTPSSGYIADRASGLRSINESCLIVFNQKKLLSYRGVTTAPVDYWGANDTGRIIGGGAKEAEERLFSDHPTLNNISEAIVEIRLSVSFEKYENYDWMIELISLCKKKKIPIKTFLRGNKQGYLRGVENKEDSKEIFAFLKNNGLTENKDTGYSTVTRAKIITKKNPAWGTNSWLKVLTELTYKNSYNDLSKETRSRLWYHLRSPDEFIKSYDADIHNMRAGHELDKKKFYALMRKMNAKNVTGFFNSLYDKWTKLKAEQDDS